MKRLKISIFVILTFSFLFPLCAEAKSENWYFVPTSDHSRPQGVLDEITLASLNSCYIGKDEKVVYLTFDIGYINENVIAIKDILKKQKVPAAFFILGHVAKTESTLLKEMVTDGHTICNHTYSHKDMSKIKDETTFLNELARLEQEYKKTNGYDISKYYRPPAGQFSKENLQFAKNGGYTTVFWSVAYADWDNNRQPNEKVALAKLMGRLHNGAVILLHPTSKTNAAILETFIQNLKADGYRFGDVHELTIK
ncbi:MAG TPA: delta-lactam-biosynthetic de-N-acetylase [Clostridiales bacterium]|nr:delta-lactam-biosynthetic de-N-acetylase [Clostridiales bacterium]